MKNCTQCNKDLPSDYPEDLCPDCYGDRLNSYRYLYDIHYEVVRYISNTLHEFEKLDLPPAQDALERYRNQVHFKMHVDRAAAACMDELRKKDEYGHKVTRDNQKLHKKLLEIREEKES